MLITAVLRPFLFGGVRVFGFGSSVIFRVICFDPELVVNKARRLRARYLSLKMTFRVFID